MSSPDTSLRLVAEVFYSIEDGAAIFDENDRLVLFNEKYTQYFLLIEDILKPGISFSEMFRELADRGLYDGPSSGVDEWVSQRTSLFASGVRGNEFRRVDGRWVRVDYYKLQMGGTFVITADITARKLSEQALRESQEDLRLAHDELERRVAERTAELRRSEERYRALFDESPAGIWEMDYSAVKRLLDGLAVDGIVDLRNYFNDNPSKLFDAYDLVRDVDISRATCEIYGAPDRQSLIEMTLAKLVGDEELGGFLDCVAAFMAGETEFAYESSDRKYNGAPMMTLSRLVMPLGFRDDWSRVLCSVEDITERRQTEERLKQAQKMEAVGQLTGGVAHDFNNLLAVIGGNAELLADDVDIDPALTAPILRAVKRGAELTQRLLAFSRQQPLRPQVIMVGALVSSMTELLARTLGETIELDASAPLNLWSALADAGQVEAALLNLAINARDAMPNGGKLTIECANTQLDEAALAEGADAVTGAGDFVVLAVSDDGTGMTDEVKAHAFEPFFTTKEVGEGSGLGLSMVYGFAKQSGGHVSIYSEVGKGTTVKLYLPRAVVAGHAAAVSPGEDIIPRGQGEVILVIEDDPDVRALAVLMLESLGYQVIDVGDAAGADEVLAGDKPVDLVLSDVVLPGGTSGPQFAERARAIYPGIKIVFMSGYPAEAAMRNGFLGADDVLLNKPFERRQLANTLRDCLV